MTGRSPCKWTPIPPTMPPYALLPFILSVLYLGYRFHDFCEQGAEQTSRWVASFHLGISCRAFSEPLPWVSRSSMLRATTKRSKAKSEASQLARASPLQGEGRGFKSLNAHHLRGQLVSGHVAPRQRGRNRHPDLIRGEEQSHQQ